MKNNDFCPSWQPLKISPVGQNDFCPFLKILQQPGPGQKGVLAFLLILLLTPSASAASRSINPGDDTIFWIIISVILSYVFLRKIWVSAILLNPFMMILLIGILLISYIAYKVAEAIFGFSNMIDGTAQGILNIITGGT